MPSQNVAWRGLIWHLAATIVAGRGLVTPRVCGRWLLVWLLIWHLAIATASGLELRSLPTTRRRPCRSR